MSNKSLGQLVLEAFDLKLNKTDPYVAVETDPTVPSWAKANNKPTYTAEEVGALDSNTEIPTKVSDLTNDAGYVSDVSGKVDKVTGKGLSTNDFTDEYKDQLDALAQGGGGGGSMDAQEVAAAFTEHYGSSVVYTLVIDETMSDCNTACTYADDAFGMEKGSAAWDSMPIFKDIKPCVFKDGEVVYYLNPANWDEKLDGTASDLTGADGDVMIEFPKFAYRIYRNGQYLYVSVTNDMWLAAIDTRFSLDAFSRITEGDLEHFYQGAYKGYVDTTTNKLRSIAGVMPTGSKTIAQFRDYAHANGAHYQQNVYSHHKALQCLYLIKYGNRNGQLALGYGAVSTSAHVTGYEATSVSSISAANSTAALGMCFGSTSIKTQHMRFLGVEDFWGNIREFVDGITTDGSYRICIDTDYSGETGVKLKKFKSNAAYTSLNTSYVRTVRGTTEEGFIGVDSGSSATAYWPDGCGLCASCVLHVGGGYSNGLSAGPFYANLGVSASNSYSVLGARLCFH